MKKILKKIKVPNVLKKEGYIRVERWMEKHKDSSMFFLAWSIWWRIAVFTLPYAILMEALRYYSN